LYVFMLVNNIHTKYKQNRMYHKTYILRRENLRHNLGQCITSNRFVWGGGISCLTRLG
jgi:hypothetical protein